MSRASAVAHKLVVEPRPQADNWPGRGDSSAYRLLGEDGGFFGGPRPLNVEEELGLLLASDQNYLDKETAMPGAYFASLEEEQPTSWLRGLTPRFLLGFAIAAVLALALVLVTPALAKTRFSYPADSHSVSRYTDLAGGAASAVDNSPQIDTTAAPQLASQQTAGSPAPAPAGEYSLIAPPSISVAQIEAVLSKYGSPVGGQG